MIKCRNRICKLICRCLSQFLFACLSFSLSFRWLSPFFFFFFFFFFFLNLFLSFYPFYVSLSPQSHHTVCVLKVALPIIITSCHQHRYPWPFLATPPYHPLLPAGLQDYIPYRHRVAVCRFELVVLPLLGHVKGSTGVHHLWARSYFSS